MAAAEEADSYRCPGCQAVEARKSLVLRDYRCSRCGLQVAHLDRRSDSATRQVVGWLQGRGKVLHGRYQVRRAIGTGGFSATYLVDDLLLKGKCWAVKEISTIQYDEREADLLSRLNHPAIPDIVDRFQSDAMVYLVLRFAGNHTLDDERKACGGTIPVAKLAPWLVQLLDVLSYLHGRTPPVVHRDLKPDNILIDERGKVALGRVGMQKFVGWPCFPPPPPPMLLN